jgi:hypothetical protein
MKVTIGRWIALTLIVCLALGAAILPADGTHWIPSWWAGEMRMPFSAWYSRMNARSRNRYDAFREFVAARDLVSARREFGSTEGKAGAPEIRFAANVPPAARAAFMNQLNSERAERAGWKDRGKVGVLVAVDSALTTHGVNVSHGSGVSAGRTMTRVIAPSALTGDRCVVQVILSGTSGWQRGVNGEPAFGGRSVLDACGYYDAFGAPGAAIRGELLDDQFELTRGYEAVDRADPIVHPTRTWQAIWYDLSAARCLSGEDGACWNLHSTFWRRSHHSFPIEWPGGSDERILVTNANAIGPINRVALILGPERFARIWRSSKTFEDAYFDETGVKWANYVRDRTRDMYGPYQPGPWTTPVSLALTLLTVAALVATALKIGRRPSVA